MDMKELLLTHERRISMIIESLALKKPTDAGNSLIQPARNEKDVFHRHYRRINLETKQTISSRPLHIKQAE